MRSHRRGQSLESNPEFQNVMETLMSQLLSKEVMYEPMKELQTKYPAYLEEHRASLSAEDLERYTKQYECVRKICSMYEEEQETESIMEVLQEMQENGSPPAEILKELGGGELGPGGFPGLPGGANPFADLAGAAGADGKECSIM